MLTVLIIDDDRDTRKALGFLLGRRGWQTLSADGPAAASALWGGADVVLTDWDMPGGGGARVLRECLLPVVVHTGAPQQVPAGVTVVTKGSDVNAIVDALAQAVEAADERLDHEKLEMISQLLEAGRGRRPGGVLIAVDARQDGVVLPDHLRGQSDVRLRLSLNFEGSLSLDEHGVVAGLSFDRHPYDCAIPWRAVWAAAAEMDGEGAMWPASAPAEALSATARSAAPASCAVIRGDGKTTERRRGHLRVVREDEER